MIKIGPAFLAVLLLTGLAMAQTPPSQSNTGALDPSYRVLGPKNGKKGDTRFRSVHGVVKNASGQAVGGAIVQLNDLRTGKSFSVTTHPDGTYRFDELDRRNDFDVIVSAKGAPKSSKKLSTYDPRNDPILNFELETKKDTASK